MWQTGHPAGAGRGVIGVFAVSLNEALLEVEL